MAWEVPLLELGQFLAGEDLSAAQYRWVKLVDGKIYRCDTDGEHAFGILQNAPLINEPCSLRVLGVSKVVVAASEALSSGDLIGTTNVGTATVVQGTSTGADLGDYPMGMVLENITGSSPASILGTVLIRPLGRVTA